MGAIDYGMLAAYAVGIILLYIIGKSLATPAKVFGKLIINAVLGGIMLIIINYVGHFVEFKIALNLATALIAGFLGIPGVVLLIILTKLFT